MARTSNLEKKKVIREYLVNRDFENIKKWSKEDRTPLRTFSSLLFEPDPLVAWRALEALGIVSAVVARNNLENVKRQLRSLLWLMNDESGGICWNAPEAIGEVIGFFSLSYYFPEFVTGIVDTRGVVFYISIAVLFLFLAIRSLENSRWS